MDPIPKMITFSDIEPGINDFLNRMAPGHYENKDDFYFHYNDKRYNIVFRGTPASISVSIFDSDSDQMGVNLKTSRPELRNSNLDILKTYIESTLSSKGGKNGANPIKRNDHENSLNPTE